MNETMNEPAAKCPVGPKNVHVVVRGDEDADHDRAAAGADRDGAREDDALVEADLAGGLLVEGSVALRCVRCRVGLRCGGCVARRGKRAAWAGRRAAGGVGSGRAGGSWPGPLPREAAMTVDR
eukprot:7096052-Prymnesium_polylepis.1